MYEAAILRYGCGLCTFANYLDKINLLKIDLNKTSRVRRNDCLLDPGNHRGKIVPCVAAFAL